MRASAVVEAIGEMAIFNHELGLERVGGDAELLKEVVELFRREYPGLLRQIRGAVEAGDASRVMETAHTMKGSLATLGAEAGAKAALHLETLGRRKNLTGSGETLAELERILALLDEELSAAF